jgi:hypothetical protein
MRGVTAIAAIGMAMSGIACSDRTVRPLPNAVPPGAIRDAMSAATDARPLFDAAGLAIIPIEPGTAPPVDAPAGTVVVGGAQWIDRTGANRVVLLETASADRRSIALQARLLGNHDAVVRIVNDRVDACPDHNLTGFAPPTATITDVDGDGLAEVGFGYLRGCTGGGITVKQLLLIGGNKYIVRGNAPQAASPEPAPAEWPAGTLDLALAAFRDNAGALDAADVIAVTDEPTGILDRDSELPRVDQVRRDGAVDIEMSYPRLDMLPRSEAGTLTSRMRAYLQFDRTFSRKLHGEYHAACDLVLLTPLVVSIDCRRDDRTRRAAVDASDPLPPSPGAVHRSITVWRTGDHADVELTELGVATTTCPWVLDRSGVTWSLDRDHSEATCGPDRLWADLNPTTDTARALVAAFAAP